MVVAQPEITLCDLPGIHVSFYIFRGRLVTYFTVLFDKPVYINPLILK
jgi:hypothetical protein